VKTTSTRQWLLTSNWAGVFAYPIELLSQGQSSPACGCSTRHASGSRRFPPALSKPACRTGHLHPPRASRSYRRAGDVSDSSALRLHEEEVLP
jgi:hypothetical protein